MGLNSGALYQALRGHIERRITGELRRLTKKPILSCNWEWVSLAWNQSEPSMASLIDNTPHRIKVDVAPGEERLYEVRSDALGNMSIRQVTEWRCVI